MGLPCAFVKKLRDGDHVMVCNHVFEENLRDGHLLSCIVGKLQRKSPPIEVKYPDGSTGNCDVVITCGDCEPSGKGIDLLEFQWEKGIGMISIPERAA